MKRFLLAAVTILSLSTVCMAQNRFSCNFKVTVASSGELVVSGKAFVQDSCYRFESPGGALYCNGKDRWLHDVANHELVIQKNDLSMIAGIDLSLLKDESCTFDYSSFKIELSAIKPAIKPWPAEFFIIDPDSFDADTIITDLR